MTTAYQRILLSEGIGYSEILDPKFKTNLLKICFFQPLSPEYASASALAGVLLTTSCNAYPTIAALNQKLHMLYGASLGCTVTRQGDLQCITLCATAIADRYALDGENILNEILTILLGCLFEPHLENGVFAETEFRIKQADLLDNIDAEINEKRQYALLQAGKTAYRNEPASYSCYGTHEDAAALTPECVYAAYQELLRKAQIEIFFVGAESNPEVKAKLQKAFSAIPQRTPQPMTFYAPSPVKPSPCIVRESLPVNQCKMVLAWKTASADFYAMKLMSLIFGGTPSSKLFANVREKMSLCYYCAANYMERKQTLLSDCGIESENIEKTKDAILAQLQELQSGNITEDELESAKMFVHNTMRGVGDTPSSYITWYLAQFCRGTQMTTEEEERAYQEVNKERIIAAANSLTLDTIYIMDCKEQEA